MMKSAERDGIGADDINEEVDSVFEVIFEAMHHREGSRQTDRHRDIVPDGKDWTLQMLIDSKMTVRAHCHHSPCNHSQVLDLVSCAIASAPMRRNGR
ncbi:hypothetical protein X760_31660 [Mesorhizobium sp. LSHC422A00]|uniref:DUF768 domain-containing protein n=1 Tax=Mesorhizobium sp. LSHC422A00 TaxID=1287294 RepID=UPI0003CF8FDF|nr:DUF768 domain-containing protein [Mesorhizobium sp. LSHC422A00]ESX50800.1 hypothetical protein X760_31660 [Mesorhizobium sp. LSHC422A00]